VFDITNDLGNQKGGTVETSSDKIIVGGNTEDKYADMINRLLNNDNVAEKEMINLDIESLVKSNVYKKLKHKQKELVYNKINDLIPKDDKKLVKEESNKQKLDKAYFICKNCGNRKPIEPGTLIFSRVSSDVAQSYTSSDVNDMKFSDILPRTRKYICLNNKCESHTNLNKREAVFFRINNSFKVKYICTTCGTSF
jgi:hypothetical protein